MKTYQKFMSRLRGWERLRLREPVQDQPPLQTIEMVRSELEAAESELSRQTMRRREMESDMNALKNYVKARMLWDPQHLGPDALIATFLRGCERGVTTVDAASSD